MRRSGSAFSPTTLAALHGISRDDAVMAIARALHGEPAPALSVGPADEVRRVMVRSDGVLLDRVRSRRRAVDRHRARVWVGR